MDYRRKRRVTVAIGDSLFCFKRTELNHTYINNESRLLNVDYKVKMLKADCYPLACLSWGLSYLYLSPGLTSALSY